MEGHVHAVHVVPDVERAEPGGGAASGVPLLRPRGAGLAARFDAMLGDRHPVTAFLSAVILGYVLLAAASIAVGLFVTKVLLESGGIERLGERLPKGVGGPPT